ncbi:hypothetical protein T484DRAFT_1982266 [Baffinella frigidus]|nr:hypothetical protein T484DRAFT_1982266 [Cryptophyta sp. CCMP2293]
MDTQTQSAPMRDSLHSVGTKVTDAFDSFVVCAPKITLLSTKTVSDNTSTSTPAARHPQIPMRASSLPICVEPSAPSSSATARDQLTNDSTRRLPLPHTTARRASLPAILPRIAEEKDSGKIPVRAAIRALRRAVAYADQLQSERKVRERDTREEEKDQGPSRCLSLERDATSTTTPTSYPAVTNASSRRPSLPTPSPSKDIEKAAARHATRFSGWGLVAWDMWRKGRARRASEGVQTGRTSWF